MVQLVGLLQSLGDRKGAEIAKHYVMKSKQAMEKQKQRYKTKLTRKGPVSKVNRKKYLMASVDGSLDQLHVADSPMISRKNVGSKNLTGTWSPGLRKWYNARPADGTGGTWSHNIGNTVKNRHSFPDSFQQPNLYRTQGITERLNSQEGDLEEIMRSVRPSFYTLGDFMEPVHHRVTSDEGSITEYEEIEEDQNFRSRLVMPSAFGSVRHIKDLKQVTYPSLPD